MVFETYEDSVESGAPVETYHFSVGTSQYFYTSDPAGFAFGGNNYLARQIRRSAPAQSNEDRRAQLEVTLPSEDPVASRFVGIIPGSVMNLTITRFHRGDTEAFVVWSGVVLGASYGLNGGQCTLRCVTSESSFSRSIPRFKYQSLCNHVLFDSSCSVASTSYKHTDTCSAASGNDVTVNNLATTFPLANWAKGGYATFDGSDYRLILAQSGDTITLFIPFENDPLGQQIDVFAGCDHSLATCKAKFSNVINFGGFPYVPTVNPYVIGIG